MKTCKCGRPLIKKSMIWKDMPRCGRCQLIGLAMFAEMPSEEDTIEDIHTGEQLGATLRDIAKTAERIR